MKTIQSTIKQLIYRCYIAKNALRALLSILLLLSLGTSPI
jgi:hypothetical protein